MCVQGVPKRINSRKVRIKQRTKYRTPCHYSLTLLCQEVFNYECVLYFQILCKNFAYTNCHDAYKTVYKPQVVSA